MQALTSVHTQPRNALPLLRENAHIKVFDGRSQLTRSDESLRRDLTGLIDAGLMSNLTTLALEVSDSFSPAILELVSRLSGLHILLLDFADCPIRHDEVRTALQPLVHLRHLAFNGDSYIEDYPGSNFEDAEGHQDFWNPQSLVINEEERHLLRLEHAKDDVMAIFDRVHLHRMLLVAKHYDEELPKLEWLFVGGYPMAIEDGRPEALSEKRIFGVFLFPYIFGVRDIVFKA